MVRIPACLLRNLYAGQEAAITTRQGTADWFQIGEGVHQGCILLPCLFNLYAEYIMRNPWRKKWQPTPVFLPGKSHGWRSLVGYCPWGPKESDMTEQLHLHFHEKRWARRSTIWNQDCQEKYQQPQICRWHHPYGRKWRGTKEPLDESERGEWKAGLKLNIQKTKIMASSPTTSWQIDGETMETVRDYIFWASKSLQMVIAAMKLKDDCSFEAELWPN